MADEIRSGKAGTELRAQFDVLNTEALLRLGYHLSFGKVDPNSFDSQWNYGRTLEGLNVSQEIERALDADDAVQPDRSAEAHALSLRQSQARADALS